MKAVGETYAGRVSPGPVLSVFPARPQAKCEIERPAKLTRKNLSKRIGQSLRSIEERTTIRVTNLRFAWIAFFSLASRHGSERRERTKPRDEVLADIFQSIKDRRA